jgi:hypothetical protein
LDDILQVQCGTAATLSRQRTGPPISIGADGFSSDISSSAARLPMAR